MLLSKIHGAIDISINGIKPGCICETNGNICPFVFSDDNKEGEKEVSQPFVKIFNKLTVRLNVSFVPPEVNLPGIKMPGINQIVIFWCDRS